YTVPCWVCERSWGSSSMHQLLVGQYAIPGSAGSIAQGCWSLPPIADGQAWVLRCASSGECSLTFTGRPVFMSTFSAQLVVTYLVARSSVPSVRSDRKSTRLNSSHVAISYAVFCLKKKTHQLSLRSTRVCARVYGL